MMPIPWDFLQQNLVTQSEIAARLKLDRAVPTMWKNQHDDWPEPVLRFVTWAGGGGSDLYWWPDIEAFCARHGVTPGKGMPRGRPPGAGAGRNSARDEKIIARARGGEKHEDIAADSGISRQRVSQIVSRAR